MELTAELTTSWQSRVRKDLDAIRKRFEDADRRLLATAVFNGEPDPEVEVERLEALGEIEAAEWELADLFLLLLRYAIRHRRAAVQDLLFPPDEPATDAEMLRFFRGLKRSPEARSLLRNLLTEGGAD